MDFESAPYGGNNVTVGRDGWVTCVAGRRRKRERKRAVSLGGQTTSLRSEGGRRR